MRAAMSFDLRAQGEVRMEYDSAYPTLFNESCHGFPRFQLLAYSFYPFSAFQTHIWETRALTVSSKAVWTSTKLQPNSQAREADSGTNKRSTRSIGYAAEIERKRASQRELWLRSGQTPYVNKFLDLIVLTSLIGPLETFGKMPDQQAYELIQQAI